MGNDNQIFIPRTLCTVASGECFTAGECIGSCHARPNVPPQQAAVSTHPDEADYREAHRILSELTGNNEASVTLTSLAHRVRTIITAAAQAPTRCEPTASDDSPQMPRSTLWQEVVHAQAEMRTWSAEKLASVQLEGRDIYAHRE
jgi:hypothetical protein